MMGSLSDVYGRRKFIVFTLAIFAIASASFTGFALGYVSAWPYIVANGVQVRLWCHPCYCCAHSQVTN